MATSVPLLDIRETGNVLIIGFIRADMTDAGLITKIGDEIYHIVKEVEKPRLVVDFAKVERLSSATLGMLVSLRKVVQKMDGQLRISNVANGLMEIFKLTRLDVTLGVCKSTEVAMESFRRRSDEAMQRRKGGLRFAVPPQNLLCAGRSAGGLTPRIARTSRMSSEVVTLTLVTSPSTA